MRSYLEYRESNLFFFPKKNKQKNKTKPNKNPKGSLGEKVRENSLVKIHSIVRDILIPAKDYYNEINT